MADIYQPDDVSEIIPSDSVFLVQVVNKIDATTEPTQREPTSMTNEVHSKHDIFEKLKQAQEFAENQVQVCIATASAEIVRLRELNAETKRKLNSQIFAWKTRADSELKKRLQLEKELKIMADQKLRADHICIEANRQCEFLGRENAHLLEELQVGRSKLAHVDAQRRDFHHQLSALRTTLGLLSREPVPQPRLSREPLPASFLSPTHFRPASAPPRSNPNFGMPENPQIQYAPPPVITDRPAASKVQSPPRPAWITRPNECDSVKETNSSNSDSVVEVPPSPPPVECTQDDAAADAYEDDFELSDHSVSDFTEFSDEEMGYTSIDEEICVSPLVSSRRTPKTKALAASSPAARRIDSYLLRPNE